MAKKTTTSSEASQEQRKRSQQRAEAIEAQTLFDSGDVDALKKFDEAMRQLRTSIVSDGRPFTFALSKSEGETTVKLVVKPKPEPKQ